MVSYHHITTSIGLLSISIPIQSFTTFLIFSPYVVWLWTPHKNSSVLLDTHGTMLITLLISEPLAQIYDYIGSKFKWYRIFYTFPCKSLCKKSSVWSDIFTFDKRHPDWLMVYLEHLLEVGIIFQDIWTGVTFESQAKQEYGRNEKLGDKTSSTKTTLWSTLLT